MIMMVIIFLSLIVPNVILISRRRKTQSSEDPAGWGLFSGLLPMIIVALWDVYFIVCYHKVYDFNEMQLMEGFNLMVFVLIPILVPIYANLLWKRSTQPLMGKRLWLYLALLLLFVLYFQLPLTWDFTFVVFPFSLLLMTVGFCFLRRKKTETPVPS